MIVGAIADNVEKTRMDARNLATVFGPSLLDHRDPMRALHAVRDSIVVVTRLIHERGVVFGEHAARHPANVFRCVPCWFDPLIQCKCF